MKTTVILLRLAFLLLVGVVSASAGSVTYTLIGTGTGDLNGVALSDTSFTVTVLGSTSGVVNGGGGIFSNDSLGTSISITGFSTATFVTLPAFFDSQPNQAPGLSRAGCFGLDLVDFSTQPMQATTFPRP